jgi:hypothetical protein
MAAEHVALSMEGTVVNATPWRRFFIPEQAVLPTSSLLGSVG